MEILKKTYSSFFTILFLFNIASPQITQPCCNAMNGVSIGGYWELDEKYYPKTVAYFEKLSEKYPVLKNIDILLLNGPCADVDTIYFPIKWIEKIEKGNKFYKDATEWIILHEAGHIHHKDVIKTIPATYGIMASYLAIIFAQNFNTSNKTLLYGLAAGLSIASVARLLYLLSTREYQADDFACKHCDNPEAWIAAYEFLDRFAPLGWLPKIRHSCTKYRLERISKAFQEKFGYELVVIPQSLNPTFVD